MTTLFLIISIIFVLVSSASEAVMDKLQFHWYKSIFSINPRKYYEDFWNPYFSWKNKYSNVETKEPKFFGSTSIFVFLTDGWHLFKFFKNLSIFLSIGFSTLMGIYYNFTINPILFTIIYVCGLRILYGLNFTLFFNVILQYKDVYGIGGKENTPGNEVNSTWNDEVNGTL